MPWEWAKEDRYGLNFYARQSVGHILPEGVSSFDLLQEPDGNRKLVQVIYEALKAKRVTYAREPATRATEIQQVRAEADILEKERQGTCLDLALLFSSLCIKYNLCPFLIRLEGHALVAVSLMKTLHDWKSRDERNIFNTVLVERDEQKQRLIELISRGSYLAVECTGFASSTTLGELGEAPECAGRGEDGCQTFEAATEAGKQHFLTKVRPFLYAIDVARAHFYYNLKPAADANRWAQEAASHRADARGEPEPFDPLPYLLDRSDQENALRNALLAHQDSKPRRPLVCVIHGDEYEGHRYFLNRLHQKSLPALLEFWFPEEANEAILARPVKLSLTQAAGDNCEEVFWNDLDAGLTSDLRSWRDTAARLTAGLKTADAVVSLVSGQKLAVMLNITLGSTALSKVPLERLDRFLEFLNNWPNLSGKALFLVCLDFEYERKLERNRLSRWLGLKGFNDRLRRYVETLDFTRYPNLHGVRLPELRSIVRDDAVEAVNHSLVRRCYKGLTELDVIHLYESRLCTADGVPMLYVLDNFAKKLR